MREFGLLAALFGIWAIPVQADKGKSLTEDQVKTYASTAVELYKEADSAWGIEDTAYHLKRSTKFKLDDTHGLIRVSCGLYPYTETSLWLFENSDGKVDPIFFAEPYVDVDADFISGVQTRYYLHNAEFDLVSGKLISYTRWRGMDDANSTSTWQIKKNESDENYFFVLTDFEADTSFDMVNEVNVVWSVTD